MQVIPHVRLSIDENDIVAVTQVLRSGQIAMGAVATELEGEIAARSGQRHAAVVSSGTTALHVALIALGVGEGDEVIMPDYACQALLNAVKYVGADVRIVDIDLATFNIDPVATKQAITPKTKAVIVPHMFGLMADMPALRALGVPLIEDCAMGIGAALHGKPAGSFGDIATFSFYATKLVTSGEGGAVATSDASLVESARDVREYDKKKEFRVRYNYKMSDMNAALALSQIQKVEEFIQKRNEIAQRYEKGLTGTSFILPTIPEGHEHAFARYVIRTDDADKLRTHLRERGIGAGKGVVFGIHELLPTSSDRYPISEEVLRTAVSLPIYPTLTEAEQDTIIESLRAY